MGSIAFPRLPEKGETLFPRGGGGGVGRPGGGPPGVCFKIELEPGGVEPRSLVQSPNYGCANVDVGSEVTNQPPRLRTVTGWEVHVWRSQIKTCQQA